MANYKLSFNIVFYQLKEFLISQKIFFSEKLYLEFLEFLSKACTYEEEDKKIRPSLIIGTNLTDINLKKIFQTTIIPLIKENIDNSHLNKHLKSLLPFCLNGWRIFISLEGNDVIYGIIRRFDGPTGLFLEDLFLNTSKEEFESLKVNFLLVDIVNNFGICLKNSVDVYNIDFRLTNNEVETENSRENFCDDLLSYYESDAQQLKNAYKKIIKLFSSKLHGSICLIINYNYNLPDDVIMDGIFIDPPLDLCNILIDEINNKDNEKSSIISAHEKYYAYTGLFLEMLNIDGITVVDNRGRLRAFNVFVKPDVDGSKMLVGGARKRAAEYLAKQTNENYIGLYFQSQDGMCSYKRMLNK